MSWVKMNWDLNTCVLGYCISYHSTVTITECFFFFFFLFFIKYKVCSRHKDSDLDLRIQNKQEVRDFFVSLSKYLIMHTAENIYALVSK